MVEQDRQKDDNIMWRMRIARWINNASHARARTHTHTHTHKHTHLKYETHCFSTAEKVMRTLFTVTFIRTCLSCS